MPYKTCRHILENGNFCNSPALSKRDYCYFHVEFRARRLKMARARARSEQWWLDLPCIEDMRSCEAATSRVIEGMSARVIEPALGKVLLSGLRLASSNFKARKAWTSLSDYRVNHAFGFVGAYPGFEAVHDLPEDIDLDENPLKLFPMPQQHEATGAPPNPSFGLSGKSGAAPLANNEERIANGEYRAAENQPSVLDLTVTAEDMELTDIANRDGQDAMLKRAAELERNRRRRERRLQRARYEELAHNRNIQLAAQKLNADRQRAEAANPQPTAHAGAIPVKSPVIANAWVGQNVEVANTSSPTGAATTTAQDGAAGGILGTAANLPESRSDATSALPGRKPPTSAATTPATDTAAGANTPASAGGAR